MHIYVIGILYFLGSGFQTSCSKGISDEEVTLNVDGDESELYGRPQYPLYM